MAITRISQVRAPVTLNAPRTAFAGIGALASAFTSGSPGYFAITGPSAGASRSIVNEPSQSGFTVTNGDGQGGNTNLRISSTLNQFHTAGEGAPGGQVPFYSGAGNVATFDSTAFTRGLMTSASAGAFRTGIGLGSAAVQNDDRYNHRSNNLSDVASASTSRTNLGLGTAAVENDDRYNHRSNNLSDVASAATARTNLGLGTAAVEADTRYNHRANNLSDVASVSTARSNLDFDQGVNTDDSPVFAGLEVDGVTVAPDGALIGQALGFPNSATVAEPYTPAGAGDMLKAENLAGLPDIAAARSNIGAGDTLNAANEMIAGAWTLPEQRVTAKEEAPVPPGPETRRLFDIIRKEVPLTPADAGIEEGDMSSSAASAMAALLASGKQIHLPPGTWRMPDVSLTTPLYLSGHKDARLRAANLPDTANSGVIRLLAGAERSVLEGFLIDGARDVLTDIPLTGTWSSSGTTLTGTGGAALSELTVGDWVRHEGWSREVAAVVDDNEITIETAFTSPSTTSAQPISDFSNAEITFNRYRRPAQGVIYIEADDCRLYDLEAENAFEFVIHGTKKWDLDMLVARNCGQILWYEPPQGETIWQAMTANVRGDNIGHNGSEFNRAAISFRRHRESIFRDIRLTNLYGNMDRWFTQGLVGKNSERCSVVNPIVSGFQTDGAEVASSMGIVNGAIINPQYSQFSSVGQEVSTASGMSIVGGVIDAMYRDTLYAGRGNSTGIDIHAGDFYDDRSRRPIHAGQPVRVYGTLVQRNQIGVRCKSPSYLNGVRAIGNLSEGIRCPISAGNSGVNQISDKPFVQLVGCEATFNGGAGLRGDNSESISASGGRYNNNAQRTTSTSTGGGVVWTNGRGVHRLVNAECDDTQNWTKADAISYAPGAAQAVEIGDGSGGTITVYRKEVTAVDLHDREISPGQRLSLPQAGGTGVDLVGYVLDNARDEILLEFDTAVTFDATEHLVALSGTWTGSGTTLTGTSGQANTEITGHFWLKHPTLDEYRLVHSNSGNNSIRINAPFSSAVSGTLSKVSAPVNGVPSQQRGLTMTSPGSDFRYFVSGVHPRGNIDMPMNVVLGNIPNSTANILPGSEIYIQTNRTVTTPVGSPGGQKSGDSTAPSVTAGMRLLSARIQMQSTPSGPTTFDWRLATNNDVSTIAELGTGIAATANTQAFAEPLAMLEGTANSNRLVVEFDTDLDADTSVTYRILSFWRRERLPAFPNV